MVILRSFSYVRSKYETSISQILPSETSCFSSVHDPSPCYILVFEDFFIRSPYLSGIIFSFAYREYNIRKYLLVDWICTIIISVIELIFVIMLMIRVRRTINKFRRPPYLEHRINPDNIRFFLRLNLFFYIYFVTMQLSLLLSAPNGDFIFFVSPILDVLLAGLQWQITAAVFIPVVAYTSCMAYIHLSFKSSSPLDQLFMMLSQR